MSWNRNEKLAILKSLALIVTADNETAPAEANFLAKFLHMLDMSPSDIQAVNQMTNEEMCRILSNFTSAEKDAVKAFWLEAAKADGKVVDSEIKMIANLSVFSNIDF